VETKKGKGMIKIKRIKVQPTDVYDITVPETSCFYANNILVHNCAEIVLPTVPIGTKTKKLIRVKKSDVSNFFDTAPDRFVTIKKISDGRSNG
jgi:hypothetical protein